MDIEKEVAYPADWAHKLTIGFGNAKLTMWGCGQNPGLLRR
jgi:hypothetical protein